jgi:chromosome condensin MukBEF complex kleisin-like MukF subunit
MVILHGFTIFSFTDTLVNEKSKKLVDLQDKMDKMADDLKMKMDEIDERMQVCSHEYIAKLITDNYGNIVNL